MVKIRLTRVGSKKNPHYRLVAVPAREKRESKFLEILGFYDPHTKEISFDKERIKYWREHGAQLSETVTRLLGEKEKHDYSKNKRVLENIAKEKTKKEKSAPAEVSATTKAEKTETKKEEKVKTETKPESEKK